MGRLKPARFIVGWRQAIGVLISIAALPGEDQTPTTPHPPAQHAIEDHYDPLSGIDASGRIPKVPMPGDCAPPERWRYIPEGRIAPGGPWSRFLVTSFVSPIIYYEKDIGVGGGVAFTDIDFRNQRRREFLGVFAAQSTEGQENYAAIWRRNLAVRDLPSGGVAIEERSWVRATVAYERSRTRRFFGFDAETTADDETSITDETTVIAVLAQRSLPTPGDVWVGVLGVRGEHHNLTRGRVSDRPSTTVVYPDLVAADDSHDTLWTTLGGRYDTRDSQHQPYRGWSLGATVDVAAPQDGGEAGAVWELRSTWATPLPSPWHDGGDAHEENPPTDTLALGAFVQAASGALPFYDLPSLGGSHTLRGYIANRFTGRDAWHASAEYRTWLIPRGYAFTDSIRIERLGVALFYDVGTVADTPSELSGATIHDSYGLGMRLAFERTAVFRVDVGFSSDGSAVTASFGMPF